MSAKKLAWLNRGTARSHTAKPMSEDKNAILRRRFVAKKSGAKAVADEETGTLRYPKPTWEAADKAGWLDRA